MNSLSTQHRNQEPIARKMRSVSHASSSSSGFAHLDLRDSSVAQAKLNATSKSNQTSQLLSWSPPNITQRKSAGQLTGQIKTKPTPVDSNSGPPIQLIAGTITRAPKNIHHQAFFVQTPDGKSYGVPFGVVVQAGDHVTFDIAAGGLYLATNVVVTERGLSHLASRQLDAAAAAHAATGSPHTLQAPTMAVGRFRDPDGVHLKTSNQRNLPGTRAQAATDRLEILPPVGGAYPNMHAEMRGVHHSIEQTRAGKPTSVEEMGASQEICMLCELVMTMLGIAYDKKHVSKIVYGKWDDPTGKFRDAGGFVGLDAVLVNLGVDKGEARLRLIHRLSQEMPEVKATAFADRILHGELQSAGSRKAIMRELKAFKSIKSSAAGGRAAGGRKSSTKKGRREARALAKARRAHFGAAGAGAASSSSSAAPMAAAAASTSSHGSSEDDDSELSSGEEEDAMAGGGGGGGTY